MAEVRIQVSVTVDGWVHKFNDFDEYGFSIPGLGPDDPFGRVAEVADTIHRALYPHGDVPVDSLKTLIEDGVGE